MWLMHLLEPKYRHVRVIHFLFDATESDFFFMQLSHTFRREERKKMAILRCCHTLDGSLHFEEIHQQGTYHFHFEAWPSTVA